MAIKIGNIGWGWIALLVFVSAVLGAIASRLDERPMYSDSKEIQVQQQCIDSLREQLDGGLE